MSRWRVEGHYGPHQIVWPEPGEAICTRWAAISPDGLALEFPTHAEALAYSDQQTRTATVTLPRVDASRVTKVHGTAIITTTTGIVIHGYPRAGHRLQEVFVPHERAEQVALALLAHVKGA